MQLIDSQIETDSNIFLIGDTHEGARLFDVDGWDAFVEMLNSPYEGVTSNYYVDHGDSIEGIHVDDKRYGIDETTESRTLLQMDEAVKRRKPIASKCLCWLTGNHEYKLQKFGDISDRMARDLGVPYGTYSAKITYRVNGKILFKHFATHGYGTMMHMAGDEEQRLANQRVKLKRMLRFKSADSFLNSMGHTHRLLVRPPLIKLNLIDDGRKLRQVYDQTPNGYRQGDILHEDMRWYVNTGCFLKTLALGYSGYAERAGYDPNTLGFAVALVRGGRLVNVREEKI
jgi:hypothetical protein